MNFWEHFLELRSRIIKVLISFAVAFIAVYPFNKILQNILLFPAKGIITKLKYIEVSEAFLMHINLTMMAAAIFTIPIALWQFWKFVEPALYQNERKIILRSFGFSVLMFVLGILFVYFIMLPYSLGFFMSYQTQFLAAEITLRSYISFASFLLIAGGISFQIPIILIILIMTNAISREFFCKQRKIVFIVLLAISAILTPPDGLTMLILAIPLYLLFELSLVITYFKKNKKDEA